MESSKKESLPPNLCRFRELRLESEVTVSGSSMDPEMPHGTRIRLRGGTAGLAVGEVIGFWDGERVVVHRIEEVRCGTGGNQYRTRGDACSQADGWIDAEAVVGRVVESAPRQSSLVARVSKATRQALEAVNSVLRTGFEAAQIGGPTITLESVLKPRVDVVSRDLDSELLLCHESGSKVQVLNRSAREIFLMLDGKLRLGDIVSRISDRYGQDVTQDVLSLASNLHGLGILEDVESSPHPPPQ